VDEFCHFFALISVEFHVVAVADGDGVHLGDDGEIVAVVAVVAVVVAVVAVVVAVVAVVEAAGVGFVLILVAVAMHL